MMGEIEQIKTSDLTGIIREEGEVTYSGSLSKLQENIIHIIANETVNILECDMAEERYDVNMGDHYYSHDWFCDGSMKYSKVLRETFSTYWAYDNDTIKNNHRVTFSKAVHNLVEKKGLVGAYALAWIFIGHTPGGSLVEDKICWQGGEHKRNSKSGDIEYKDNVPPYELLHLTPNGWELARDLFDDKIGMCDVLAERLSRIKRGRVKGEV